MHFRLPALSLFLDSHNGTLALQLQLHCSVHLSLSLTISLFLSPSCGRRCAPSAYGFGAFYATYAAYVARVLVQFGICVFVFLLYNSHFVIFQNSTNFFLLLPGKSKHKRKGGKGAGETVSVFPGFIDVLHMCMIYNLHIYL